MYFKNFISNCRPNLSLFIVITSDLKNEQLFPVKSKSNCTSISHNTSNLSGQGSRNTLINISSTSFKSKVTQEKALEFSLLEALKTAF